MTKTITNTLAGFKQMLAIAKANGIFLHSTITNPAGEIVRQSTPAPVGILQSNSFALEREGKMYWCEFGKASDWQFDLAKGTASKKIGSDTLTYIFSDPAFFGI